MGMRENDPVQGEVISSGSRIQELEEEIADLQGDSNTALARLIQNPAQLRGMLNLSPEQAGNVRALVIGAGTAMSDKYLSKHFGDVLASVAGAAMAAFLAKKILG